jgi:hypothetical protein
MAVLVWLLARAGVSAQEPVNYNDPNVLNVKIVQLFRSDGKDTSWITPALRPLVIARLKAMMSDEIANGDSWAPEAQRALLELNDEDTIQKLAQAFHAGNSVAGGILEDFGREGAIKYVAEDISTGSPKWTGGGDVLIAPVRMQAAWMVSAEIANSPAFPKATRDWAKLTGMRLRQVASPGSVSAQEEMKKWWDHNKDSVLNRQYAKATWLPDEERADQGGPSHMPTPLPQLPQTPPTSDAPTKQSPSPSPLPVIAETDGFAWVYVVAFVAVGGLAALGVGYFRHWSK